jgi:hypothetical protein
VTGPLPAQEKPEGSPLADKQDVVKERVARLEDRMFQISQAIRKSEPEKAGQLLEALGATRGMAVRQKMEEIVGKLRSEQYSDAAESQEAVIADLQTLLRMMLDEPDRQEERKDEIKKLQSIRETLEKIITEQRQEKSDAEASATSREQAQAIQAAIAKSRELLDRQRELSARTARPEAKPAEQSAEQSQLRKEAESIAETTKALPGQPAAEELSGAANKMKAAEDWLLKEQVPDAGESQKEAEEKLEQAIQRLEQQVKKLADKKPLDQQACNQRDTAGKTKDLSGEMKPDGGDSQEPGEKGGEQGQKPGGPPQEGGEQTPMKGQQDVEQASKLQEDAAKKLDEKKPDDAVTKQEEALKKLEQAQQELADTLDQLRKEQQEEMLAALEARFRAMLEKQMGCSKDTARLVALGKENWKRSHQLELGELSQKQKEIGDEADKALYVLTEDGTTVVFPQIVQQVRDDAREVATRLAAADATAGVRRMQDGIEQALRELIDAVKKKQEENEGGHQASASGGQEGPRPLLPGSAELKLLKSCQTRVNRATADLRAERDKPDVREQGLSERIEKLARRQEEVSRMAKEMHEAMTKAQ